MLLWILLSTGLMLGVVAFACVSATIRAERRARRNLYASFDLNEDLISALMAQRGSVSVQLARIRQASISRGIRLQDLRPSEGGGDRPAFAPARRNPPSGRDGV
ncbi:MAG: hypothetical protein ACREE0_04340 [Phenylobacterium sp.]